MGVKPAAVTRGGGCREGSLARLGKREAGAEAPRKRDLLYPSLAPSVTSGRACSSPSRISG